MKKKKKMVLPRVQWHIKPVTKVKDSAKRYKRNKERQNLQKEDW